MKVLISPGYGAGWSTWAYSPEAASFSRTYQPIIDALEAGEQLHDSHPVIEKFMADLKVATGEEHFYTGGLEDLVVEEVTPPFQIHEYDGSESITYPGGDHNWIME